MAILPLVIAPDVRLKTKSLPVDMFDAGLKRLAADLFDTMYDARGIGLAAVQVGVLKRLLVTDVDWRDEAGPGKQYVMVNPEIIGDNGTPNLYKEGCLSFPDQYAEVERPLEVQVRFQDLDGNWQEEGLSGLLATCVQHEIDHLNGIVFPDRISPVRRDMILRKMKKIKKDIEAHAHHHHEHGPNCNHD